MKQMISKKAIALLFTVVMTFTIIPATVFAAGNGEVQPAKAFMDPPEQLNKPSEVNGTNWMSAIPGERYITEYNVPYSHDSATKNIDTRVMVDMPVIGGGLSSLVRAVGWRYARTQYLTVPQQLNHGVRVLDVRMNNIGPNGLVFEDDGENLWVCHGRKKIPAPITPETMSLAMVAIIPM